MPRYWTTEDSEPFPAPKPPTDPTSPLFFLRRALTWMDKYGLKASMDLHTGPLRSYRLRKGKQSKLSQDLALRMVMTTVGEEGRSDGQQETTLKKEPTLTGVSHSCHCLH